MKYEMFCDEIEKSWSQIWLRACAGPSPVQHISTLWCMLKWFNKNTKFNHCYEENTKFKYYSRSNDSISMTMTKSQINSQNYKWSNQINIGQGQNMVWQGWTDTWRILSHHLVKIMKESSCFSYQYFCLSFGN